MRRPIRKVLLLNPPAPDLVIRDNYCSKTTKSNLVPHPVDLLLQSGRLATRFEIAVHDAVAERWDAAESRRRILAWRPDAIFFLSGDVSFDYDLPFLRGVKDALGGETLLVGSGDCFLEGPDAWLAAQPWLDGLALDFSTDDVARFLLGEDEALEHFALRRGDTVRVVDGPRQRKTAFHVPLPRHDLFRHPNYHFSFLRRRPWATVMTDFGCPYPCTFCLQSVIGSKYRPVDDVMEELRHLVQMGVRDVLFHDQTWGVHRQRNLDLCAAMVDEGLDLGWTTFTRVDVVDDEVLAAWKASGCHTLMFGVEFASAEMLKRYRKGYRPEQIVTGLERTRRHGIRTVGTFLLGLPEETEETLEATVQLACDLPLDYASFNVAVPRHGTPLRAQAKALGLVDEEATMDQSGAYVAMGTTTLAPAEVLAAKRRAVRRFYLRPRWLLERVRGMGSWAELGWQVREGLALLARNARLGGTSAGLVRK
jgi:radical SAM superfamily enzyme YgiQ (UPF0313 family)